MDKWDEKQVNGWVGEKGKGEKGQKKRNKKNKRVACLTL